MRGRKSTVLRLFQVLVLIMNLSTNQPEFIVVVSLKLVPLAVDETFSVVKQKFFEPVPENFSTIL